MKHFARKVCFLQTGDGRLTTDTDMAVEISNKDGRTYLSVLVGLGKQFFVSLYPCGPVPPTLIQDATFASNHDFRFYSAEHCFGQRHVDRQLCPTDPAKGRSHRQPWGDILISRPFRGWIDGLQQQYERPFRRCKRKGNDVRQIHRPLVVLGAFAVPESRRGSRSTPSLHRHECILPELHLLVQRRKPWNLPTSF